MAADDEAPRPGRHRADSAEGAIIHDLRGNSAYGPDALTVLREQGVTAWREWVATHVIEPR
ncbi:MAG TPA: hypothetical protein VF444_06575 [Pseudonocardiaceae bacterium]